MFWGFAMEKGLESAQNGSKRTRKSRFPEEKVGGASGLFKLLSV
jgi:hypothetical protein